MKAEYRDWFYKPEVAKELLKRNQKAVSDFKKGKTIPWKKFKKICKSDQT